VRESTAAMSAVTGFNVRNSTTLQIGEELIEYAGVAREAPFAFTACRRGALGTRAAAHPRGAPVRHLKECFGLFVPDPDSTLFTEVAAATADTFNACGFDMIYFDALDGEDILAGAEHGWHYGSQFVFEVCRRLARPALIEMSTFHHHLWFARSRMGAWDFPVRSHKRFIDRHARVNEACARMFLPAHLGWWTLAGWKDVQSEPVFGDDLEYLCGKCLATDSGLSLMGITPSSFADNPSARRHAGLIRRYETLRLSGRVPEAVKALLKQPGVECRLGEEPDGRFRLRRVEYVKHTVQAGAPGATLEQTMVSMQKAQIGFQAAVTVRNKLVAAYTDIMNMQV